MRLLGCVRTTSELWATAIQHSAVWLQGGALLVAALLRCMRPPKDAGIDPALQARCARPCVGLCYTPLIHGNMPALALGNERLPLGVSQVQLRAEWRQNRNSLGSLARCDPTWAPARGVIPKMGANDHTPHAEIASALRMCLLSIMH